MKFMEIKNGNLSDILSDMLMDFNCNVLSPNGIKLFGNTNLIDKGDNYQLELLIPGVKKENVDIDIDKEILIIKVNYEETKDEKVKYLKKEFTYSSFKRKYSLDESIDKENIKALFNNGILILTMPKKVKNEDKSRKINID
jgi:HSP20 family protein